MALTEFQRGICRLIADNRKERDDAYVAGGIALNTWFRAEDASWATAPGRPWQQLSVNGFLGLLRPVHV
jgi:hypothetical protein